MQYKPKCNPDQRLTSIYISKAPVLLLNSLLRNRTRAPVRSRAKTIQRKGTTICDSGRGNNQHPQGR